MQKVFNGNAKGLKAKGLDGNAKALNGNVKALDGNAKVLDGNAKSFIKFCGEIVSKKSKKP